MLDQILFGFFSFEFLVCNFYIFIDYICCLILKIMRWILFEDLKKNEVRYNQSVLILIRFVRILQVYFENKSLFYYRYVYLERIFGKKGLCGV